MKQYFYGQSRVKPFLIIHHRKRKDAKRMAESRVKRNYGINLVLISAFASFYFSGRRSSFLIQHLKKTTTTGATAGLKGFFFVVVFFCFITNYHLTTATLI